MQFRLQAALDELRRSRDTEQATGEENALTQRLRESLQTQFPNRASRYNLDNASRGQLEGLESRFTRKREPGRRSTLLDQIGGLVEKGAPSSLLDEAGNTNSVPELRNILRKARKAIGETEAARKEADLGRINRSNRPRPSKKSKTAFPTLDQFRDEIESEARNIRFERTGDVSPEDAGPTTDGDRKNAINRVVRRLTGRSVGEFPFSNEVDLYRQLLEETKGEGPADRADMGAKDAALKAALEAAGLGGKVKDLG